MIVCHKAGRPKVKEVLNECMVYYDLAERRDDTTSEYRKSILIIRPVCSWPRIEVCREAVLNAMKNASRISS
jgi:hypothetical protein